jgi:hypothetical protein
VNMFTLEPTRGREYRMSFGKCAVFGNTCQSIISSRMAVLQVLARVLVQMDLR